MNCISLFDGISVGYQALKQANIPVTKYMSSEIDEYAMKVAQLNHPDIIQLGDITELSNEKLKAIGKVDILLCGFPCTDLSSMGKQAGLQGERSGLFYEAIRVLNEVRQNNPNVLFLFENVASMKNSEKEVISRTLGVEPLRINSSFLSAQCRNRYYWTNTPGVLIPKDAGILLQDILEDGYADRQKSHALLTNQLPQTQGGLNRYLFKSTGQIAFKEEYFAKLDKKTKLLRYANMQAIGNAPKPHGSFSKNGVFRRLSVNECESLQTLPKDYTAGISMSQRYKVLGNSYTCSVIQHILSFIPKQTVNN